MVAHMRPHRVAHMRPHRVAPMVARMVPPSFTLASGKAFNKSIGFFSCGTLQLDRPRSFPGSIPKNPSISPTIPTDKLKSYLHSDTGLLVLLMFFITVSRR